MTVRRSIGGFTIIELLIALAMLAFVSSQLLLVFQTQQKAYLANERILDVQEDARLIMDLLVQETRMAGYMVPEVAASSKIDGGANAADVFCVSDANQIADAAVVNRSIRFNRAAPAIAPGAGATTITLQGGHLDVDMDGTDDFDVGQGLIIAGGGDSFCARIVSKLGNVITIDRALDTGFTTAARVVPAIIYQVGGAGGLGLTRNGTLVSAEVEDLQVEFGVDVNLDGLIGGGGEFPIHDLNGFNPALMRQVRLTVTTRTSVADPDFNGGFDAAGNRVAGVGDNFRRRRFIASVRPRNIGNP